MAFSKIIFSSRGVFFTLGKLDFLCSFSQYLKPDKFLDRFKQRAVPDSIEECGTKVLWVASGARFDIAGLAFQIHNKLMAILIDADGSDFKMLKVFQC